MQAAVETGERVKFSEWMVLVSFGADDRLDLEPDFSRERLLLGLLSYVLIGPRASGTNQKALDLGFCTI